MECSVSNVEVCNFAYTGQFEKLKQSILSDKSLACKTDQVKTRIFFGFVFFFDKWESVIISIVLSLLLQDRRTALHWACSAGHTNIVDFLLDLGVEVNLQDDVSQDVLWH